MDLGNMRLQEGIFLDRFVTEIGVKGVSKGVGTTFVSRYLDYFLNRKGKPKVFVSRPDRFRIIDDPEDLETVDIIVSVIDPLPSLLMEGAAAISDLMDFKGDVIWLINRDNQGVNRHALKKYLGFIPDYSQEEISRESICRAEYNCIELPEIAAMEGIEEIADCIVKKYTHETLDRNAYKHL